MPIFFCLDIAGLVLPTNCKKENKQSDTNSKTILTFSF